MPRRATAIHLSEQEQEELMRLTKRHRSEQQVALRARIILAAAQGASNAQIARKLGIIVDIVRLWRGRWANGQEGEAGSSESFQTMAGRFPARSSAQIYGGTTHGLRNEF